MGRLGITAKGLVVLAATAVAGPEETAGRLWGEYLGLRADEGWKAADRRLEILRALGGCDCAKTRQTLLQLVRTSRSGDERLLAILSLAKMLDLDTAQALHDALERKPDPVVAEALAQALSGAVEPEIRAWLAGPALDTKQPDLLRACVEALGAQQSQEAVPRLVEIYRGTGDVAVQFEAVRALGRAGGARPTLVAASAHPDWRVRLAAAQALPESAVSDEVALAAVRTLLLDATPAVRRAAAMASADAKLEAVEPDLVELLGQDPRLRTRETARQALKKLCGRDFGHDVGAWRAWLRTKAEGASGDERPITSAEYFGVSVRSDRVLFVLDVSGSMSWPWRDPKRIDVARKELARVIKELPPVSLFNVIIFSTKVRSWQRSEVQADARNVAAALSWIERNVRDPEGATYVYDALEEAFGRNEEFDTICLLSDGAPSHGPFCSREGILASVRVWNRFRGAVIHTIGLTLESCGANLAEDLGLMKAFVRDLAALTGGDCRIVVRPPP